MRLYILGAIAWLVIIVRFAVHGLQKLPRRAASPQHAGEISPLSVAREPFSSEDIDPRIARIINEIPRRRVRRPLLG